MRTGGSELFISDLHLSAHMPETAARFLAFLENQARHAAQLTILGDLFDYWAGDDDLDDPFNHGIIAALRKLADNGVAIAFMPGNRDFLIGPDFAAAAGIELIPDPLLREIDGKPTLLTHGDMLCTEDLDYQQFRAMVRAPEWQSAFLARPLAARKREIEALRARSEIEKQTKPLAIMDAAPTAVAEFLEKYAAAAMIHGHTHRQGRHLHSLGERSCPRWVLGDWHADRGSVLACTAGDWRWLDA